MVLYVLNSAFLVIAGSLMAFGHKKVFPGADALAIAIAGAVAAGDFAMAATSAVMAMPSTTRSVPSLAGLSLFHFGIGVAMVAGRKTALFQLPVLIVHGLLGVAFILALSAIGPFAST
jgi:hypothetical protein